MVALAKARQNDDNIKWRPPSNVATGEVVSIGSGAIYGFADQAVPAGELGDFNLATVVAATKDNPAEAITIGETLVIAAGGLTVGAGAAKAYADSPSGESTVLARLNPGGTAGATGPAGPAVTTYWVDRPGSMTQNVAPTVGETEATIEAKSTATVFLSDGGIEYWSNPTGSSWVRDKYVDPPGGGGGGLSSASTMIKSGETLVVGDFAALDTNGELVKANNVPETHARLTISDVDGSTGTYQYERFLRTSYAWDIDEIDDGSGNGTTTTVPGSNDRYATLDSSGDLAHTVPTTEQEATVLYYLFAEGGNAVFARADGWLLTAPGGSGSTSDLRDTVADVASLPAVGENVAGEQVGDGYEVWVTSRGLAAVLSNARTSYEYPVMRSAGAAFPSEPLLNQTHFLSDGSTNRLFIWDGAAWVGVTGGQTFNTVADIVDATDLQDGETYYVRGHTAVEDSGGGWMLFSSTPFTHHPALQNVVFFDVTSGGELRRVLDAENTLVPEMAGCDGTGATDCLSDMQTWLDVWKNGQNRSYIGRGRRKYLVSDTVRMEGYNGANVQIGHVQRTSTGLAQADPLNGLVFTGAAGDGPEPNNLRPCLWIDANNCKFPALVVTQPSDHAALHTVGMLWHTGQVGQQGHITYGDIVAHGFQRGYQVGLTSYQNGLIGDPTTGLNPTQLDDYNDDLLEASHFDNWVARACMEGFHFACRTSDSWSVNQMVCIQYNPTESPPKQNFGLGSRSIHFEVQGTGRINQITCAQNELGAARIGPITFDHTAETLTSVAHGLNNGDVVRLNKPTGDNLPAELDGASRYVVGATTDTVQLSDTLGGSPIDFTDNGTGSATYLIKLDAVAASVVVSSGNPSIGSIASEDAGCAVFRDLGTNTNRGGTTIGNVYSNDNQRDENGVTISINRFVELGNTTCAGHFEAKAPCHAGSLKIKEGFGIIGTNMPTNMPTVDALYEYADEDDATTRIPNYDRERMSPIIRSVESVSTGTDKRSATLDAGTDIFTVSGGQVFADNDIVVIAGDVLPGPSASHDDFWYVIGQSGDTFQLSDELGGSAFDFANAGTNIEIRRAIKILELRAPVLSSDSFAARVDASFFVHRNSSGTHYAHIVDLKLAISRDNAGNYTETRSEFHAILDAGELSGQEIDFRARYETSADAGIDTVYAIAMAVTDDADSPVQVFAEARMMAGLANLAFTQYPSIFVQESQAGLYLIS